MQFKLIVTDFAAIQSVPDKFIKFSQFQSVWLSQNAGLSWQAEGERKQHLICNFFGATLYLGFLGYATHPFLFCGLCFCQELCQAGGDAYLFFLSKSPWEILAWQALFSRTSWGRANERGGSCTESKKIAQCPSTVRPVVLVSLTK